MEKKQQQLILGGWGWGYGSCGVYEASAEDNKIANYEGGVLQERAQTTLYVCVMKPPQGEAYNIAL